MDKRIINIWKGSEARKRNLYTGSQFILEQAPEAYDEGWWLVADGNCAEWYADTPEGIAKLSERVAEYLS